MRGDREKHRRAIQAAEPTLVIVRGSAGIGKTDLVRRWTATLHGSAVLWPHVIPPRNARNFWMRVITNLHSRGWITDQELLSAIERSRAPDADIRDITGELLGALPESPVLVIDDLRGSLDDDIYLEILSDLSSFLRSCDRMRAVIIENVPSPLVDVDLPPHLLIGEAHLPPVAFLGHVTGSPARYRLPVPGLHALVRDPRMLRDVCLAAIPPGVDAEAAGVLTGKNGEALIESLTKWGLGSLHAANRDPRFVFRTEVRAEALAELRASWPDAFAAAVQRISLLHLARGEWAPAFEYALLTEDAELITRVGLRMSPFPMDFTPKIYEGVTSLPLDRVRSNPMLSLLAASIAEHYPRPDQSAAELYRHSAKAARGLRNGLNSTERLVMLGIESYSLHQSGNIAAAVAAAMAFSEGARRLITDRLIDPELAHVFGNFAYQVAVTLIAGDEFTAAETLLSDLAHFCLAHGIEYRRRFALAALSFLEAVAGRPPSDHELPAISETPLPAPLNRSRSYQAFLDSAAVLRAGMAGDFPAPHRAVTAFRLRPHEMFWDILLYGEVLLDISIGNAGAARVRFDEAASANLVASSNRTTARRAHYVRHALVLLGEKPRLISTAGIRPLEDPIALALSAGRDIDRGDYSTASVKLSKAAIIALAPSQEHIVFTMLARLGAAGNDVEATRDAASRLLVIARSHRLNAVFALLSYDEREKVLESLGSPAELRAAFAVTRPLASENATAKSSLLTERQLVVIRALADLGSRQEVAKQLYLSPGTVKAHLRAIYKKLNAHNEAEALHKAAALNLLQQR